MKGRKYDEAEGDAAKAMANDGLLVVLTPEGGVKFRTGKSKKKKGSVRHTSLPERGKPSEG